MLSLKAVLVVLVCALLCPVRAMADDLDMARFSGIAGNPGAVNVESGTGAAGRWLGFSTDSGVRLGGVLVSNANIVATGGNDPGRGSFNNLLVLDLDVDLARLAGISGATIGGALLRFDGQESNQQAGLVTGYNGLTGLPPLDRTELYELWWRQMFFRNRLVVRIGKMVPTYDFDNVVRPVSTGDVALRIPAVTGLLYTPIFVNPTLLGALPGYYNSAYGIIATATPTDRTYLSVGLYDGNMARGVQTGLRGIPEFNTYRFAIGEAGGAWLLGTGHLPGSAGIGVWNQTGRLSLNSSNSDVTQSGTTGSYLFASQRLWRDGNHKSARGLSAFLQAGINDSRIMLVNDYVGAGLSGFGLVPGRPYDSLGLGIACSWLNPRLKQGLRNKEILLQAYDQLRVLDAFYLQPTVTLSPKAGERSVGAATVALTVQSTILL